MTEHQTTAAEKAGAEARARGASFLDNPYLRAEAMPAATGATLADWRALHDAWHRGWTLEDAIRD